LIRYISAARIYTDSYPKRELPSPYSGNDVVIPSVDYRDSVGP